MVRFFCFTAIAAVVAVSVKIGAEGHEARSDVQAEANTLLADAWLK